MNTRTHTAFGRAVCQTDRRSRGHNNFRPVLEPLEDRTLLSTFIVRNTNDSGDGSLRHAIRRANDRTGPDTIEFAIPGTACER